jgi:histidine ammonia-lyase
LPGKTYDTTDVFNVSQGARVSVSPKSMQRITRSHQVLTEKLNKGEKVYGSTNKLGGKVGEETEDPFSTQIAQEILRSHAQGSGEPLSEEVTRGTIFLRMLVFSQGHSGVQPILVDTMADMLNAGVYPYAPQHGSLGSSGDLVPLAHMALPFFHDGMVESGGKFVDARKVLKKEGIGPILLYPRDSLAIINGASSSCATASIAYEFSDRAFKTAQILTALGAEAFGSSHLPLDRRIHSPRESQLAIANNLLELLNGSKMPERINSRSLQDPYSMIRVIPLQYGSCKEGLSFAERMLNSEINSFVDNPIIVRNTVISGGNFHGIYVSSAATNIGLAMVNVGNTITSQVQLLIAGKRGLPPFLSTNCGHGRMMNEVVVVSLALENRTLFSSAAVQTIPTSLQQEDIVSNAALTSLQARKIVDNVMEQLTQGLLIAFEALRYRLENGATLSDLGRGSRVAFRFLTSLISYPKRVVEPQFNKLREAVQNGSIVDVVEDKIGKLQ